MRRIAHKARGVARHGLTSANSRLLTPFEKSEWLHRFRLNRVSRSEIFSRVYENAGWGSSESGSGCGSELVATEVVRSELGALLRRHEITSVLDAPCGDWNWMQHLDLSGIRYFGADIVESVVATNQLNYGARGSFMVADLTSDRLPSVEAILCRDCLVHVSYQDIAAILDNFRSTGAKWLLLSTYPEVKKNRNQFTGRRWRRLNFELPPFNFPAPVESLADGGNEDPSRLALWRLQELPEFTVGETQEVQAARG